MQRRLWGRVNTTQTWDRSFKVLYMIFKSEFSVKNEAKEIHFFNYFYGCFSHKDVRVLEKKKKRTIGESGCSPYMRWKT